MESHGRGGSDLRLGALRVRLALPVLLYRFFKQRRQQRGFREDTRCTLGASARVMGVTGALSSHGRGRLVHGESVWVTEVARLRTSSNGNFWRCHPDSNVFGIGFAWNWGWVTGNPKRKTKQ